MCCGFAMNTWRGPGDTYQRLGVSGSKVTSANQKSRWMPFKDEQMAHMVTAPGASNSGDAQSAEQGRGQGSLVTLKETSV